MPFAPGNKAAVGHGRSPKGESLRELLRNRPIKDKRKLIDKAYEFAFAGDARWAEWIAKHSGEGAGTLEDLGTMPAGSTIALREVIVRVPELNDGGNGDYIDAEPVALDGAGADRADHASGPVVRVAE